MTLCNTFKLATIYFVNPCYIHKPSTDSHDEDQLTIIILACTSNDNVMTKYAIYLHCFR